MTSKIQPTAEAVQTAIRNAEKMWGWYDVVPTATGDLFLVQHKRDSSRIYGVTTIPGLERCPCPYFQKEGCCKHEKFVADWREIEEGEFYAEAKAEAGIR